MTPDPAGEALATAFEHERARLRSVAYRVLGSIEEADDAVQEAWLRLARSDTAAIDNLPGWLTTVTSRICLDLLRNHRSRGEIATGLEPAPHANDTGLLGPEEEALLADGVGRALLVVMHVLTPLERLAFVLHDMFKVPFEEISAIIGKSPGAAKMMASRARRRVQGAEPDGHPDPNRKRDIVAAFTAAARGGDIDLLIELLAPDVALHVESTEMAPVLVEGAAAVSSRAVLFGAADTRSEVVLVAGTPALLTWRGTVPVAAMQLTIDDDRITRLWLTTDPATAERWAVEATRLP